MDLISKIQGVVLLSMHDEHVDELNGLDRIKNHDTVVLSIRDAKGLAFPDVILVDFFKRLPEQQQKPWRLLLQGKLAKASEQAGFPEVELQLKQLYTAITRCSQRLFFVETAASDAGQAFFRFICKEKDLAIQEEASGVQESIKTSDEWAATGVEYARHAEACETDEVCLYWLEKALHCFKQGKVKDLEWKAQVHQESVCLRMDYSTRTPRESAEDDSDFDEKGASEHVATLAKEGLLTEASKFVRAALPLLREASRRAWEDRFLPALPELDEAS
jgi:hypothetical protein